MEQQAEGATQKLEITYIMWRETRTFDLESMLLMQWVTVAWFLCWWSSLLFHWWGGPIKWCVRTGKARTPELQGWSVIWWCPWYRTHCKQTNYLCILLVEKISRNPEKFSAQKANASTQYAKSELPMDKNDFRTTYNNEFAKRLRNNTKPCVWVYFSSWVWAPASRARSQSDTCISHQLSRIRKKNKWSADIHLHQHGQPKSTAHFPQKWYELTLQNYCWFAWQHCRFKHITYFIATHPRKPDLPSKLKFNPIK